LNNQDLVLLYDLGSTFTKVAAVDVGTGRLVAWAKAASTVATDITEGLEEALCDAERQGGFVRAEARLRLASSSAAGGLRLVAVGLVPELTGEAARRAALGAGAKVVGTFSYEMTAGEAHELEGLDPDIVLLAGGTDGGNKTVLVHNGRRLAAARIHAPIVIAGNKVVADDAADVLRAAGKEVWIAQNVLPSVGVLNVDPARQAIREVFIRRIVHAKGLDRASQYVDGILMPTPTAVLAAAELLASDKTPSRIDVQPGGAPGDEAPGLSGVLVVDVGGATTDVHSVGKGEPSLPGLVPKGLPEPMSKRTVEGDLGVRWNATSILEAVGADRLAAAMAAVLPGDVSAADPGRDVCDAVARLARQTSDVPSGSWEVALDYALASSAVDLAMSRHAGQVDEVITLSGKVSVLYGKDLSQFAVVVGTGGPLVSNPFRDEILRAATWDARRPHVLKPRRPRLMVDRDYVMFAAGLLAERDRASALRLLASSLIDS
jgi:uncharacterized protein (TIGR01319 family)